MTEPTTRILLVDDHPVVREGIKRLLEKALPSGRQLEIVAEAKDEPSGMEAAKAFRPDLALVDLTLKKSSGLSLIEKLRDLDSAMRILVVSMHEEDRYAERVLRAGAHGYVMKSEMADTLVLAIEQVLKGEIYLTAAMQKIIVQRHLGGEKVQALSPDQVLSPREMEVFEHIGHAKSTAQIAETLHVSVKTVETHYARIKKKLYCRNAIQLHQKACLWVRQGKTD